MIAVDANVLVYAHRRDSDFHATAYRLVRELAEGRSYWAIPWPCLYEFLAIVTHRRIYDPPSTTDQAVDQVTAWLDSPSLVLLTEGGDHWPTLRDLLLTGHVAGALVHDAKVAAICLAHGVRELLSADRDFGRFPSLKTTNPLTA